MADPARYTVGWICALSVEYVAAQEFLDEEHENPSYVSPNDGNDYSLGKMGEHNVVIAVLPDSEYGTASAAHVAANMQNTFINIRIRLLVGIGGGVPSNKHDVRLGDVVVSASRGGQGAVFQNDFGKSIQDQDFQHTRLLDQPPHILRAAVTGIQTQYQRKGHQLEEAITRKLNKNWRLRREYGRPDPATDRLFRSDVVHASKCGAVSCADNVSYLVRRLERTEQEDNPAIHYGLIASSNQLMKDALIRDRLAAKKDVLCFEMEAAGLMNTFHCLVIRGICDYSDSHKNKEWQGYAAMVAAAYAKDLLQRIPINKIEAEERIRIPISGIDAPQSTNQNSNRAYDPRGRQQEEQTTRALAEEQIDINPRRAEETGQWTFQGSQYPQLFRPPELDIRKDKARSSGSNQGKPEIYKVPAATMNFLPLDQNRTFGTKPILGVALNRLYERDKIAVPYFLTQCFLAVERYGLTKMNVYHINGSVSDVNRIKTAFETDAPEVNWNSSNNLYQDTPIVAGLVIQFLKELPDPVFSSQHYHQFIETARIHDNIKRRDSLHALINKLPPAHGAVARDLFRHLHKVHLQSAYNQMPIWHLTSCFAFIIMGGASGDRAKDAGWQYRIFTTILENVEQIFP